VLGSLRPAKGAATSCGRWQTFSQKRFSVWNVHTTLMGIACSIARASGSSAMKHRSRFNRQEDEGSLVTLLHKRWACRGKQLKYEGPSKSRRTNTASPRNIATHQLIFLPQTSRVITTRTPCGRRALHSAGEQSNSIVQTATQVSIRGGSSDRATCRCKWFPRTIG
jgi:hypothetical protein